MALDILSRSEAEWAAIAQAEPEQGSNREGTPHPATTRPNTPMRD